MCDFVQISLYLHDSVGRIGDIVSNEHVLCALVAQLAYFKDKLEEAAQKIGCQ